MAAFLDSIGYNNWVLPALLIIPLIGSILVLLAPVRTTDGTGVESPAARQIAFWLFILEFIVSLGLWWSFNPSNTGWQASVDLPWIPSWGVRFTLGIDVWPPAIKTPRASDKPRKAVTEAPTLVPLESS